LNQEASTSQNLDSGSSKDQAVSADKGKGREVVVIDDDAMDIDGEA
jgi:hypothetical protein